MADEKNSTLFRLLRRQFDRAPDDLAVTFPDGRSHLCPAVRADVGARSQLGGRWNLSWLARRCLPAQLPGVHRAGLRHVAARCAACADQRPVQAHRTRVRDRTLERSRRCSRVRTPPITSIFRRWSSTALPGLADADPHAPLELSMTPALRRVVIIGKSEHPPLLAHDDFIASGQPTMDADLRRVEAECVGDDVATVLFTSGTAASPKGCELTHTALISAWTAYADAIGLTRETPLWAPCPMFHVGGIGPLTSAVVGRGAVHLSAALRRRGGPRAVHRARRRPPVPGLSRVHPGHPADPGLHARSGWRTCAPCSTSRHPRPRS